MLVSGLFVFVGRGLRINYADPSSRHSSCAYTATMDRYYIIDPTHHARPAADTDKSDAQLTIEIPRRVRATRPRDARDERSF